MGRFRQDSGAVAVEFALVGVVLVTVLMGIVDFGVVYNEQLSVTAAARAGARVMAVQNDAGAASSAVRSALPTAMTQAPTISGVSSCPSSATAPATVSVTVNYPVHSVTGMFDSLLGGEHLTGVGVMRCGG